jgi:hypothetical protein
MPYELSWYDAEKIVLSQFYGVLDIDGFHNFYVEMIDNYIEVGSPPVHVMADATHLEQVKPQVLELIKTIRKERHPNTGWVVVYGTNKYIRFLASVVFQMVDIKVRFTADEAEATNFLQEMIQAETTL